MLKLTQITNRHYQFNSIRLVSSHIVTSGKSQKVKRDIQTHRADVFPGPIKIKDETILKFQEEMIQQMAMELKMKQEKKQRATWL